MGGSGGACKFLGIFFILSLLLQGVCAAEESNEANANSNYTINDTVNGTIIGTINGTINNTINDTVNGTVVGTINGTINGNINGTINKIDPIQWVLIVPILVGSLIFLCWMCRFFDRMNFCFVVFILTILIALLLRLKPVNLRSTIVQNFAIIALLLILTITVYYEIFSKQRKENKNNPIINLHDIIRNFILIFATLMWPLLLLYLYKHNVESITFYGIEKLEFPIYIIAASTIGSLSYLLLSIEETFGQLIPEYKKIGIAWSYIRRILLAPFVALIAIYILPFQNPTEVDPENVIFIFVFSFFAGFYTKTVEKWVYLGVQKLLPNDSQVEFNSRTDEYDVIKSDFITKLGLDEDLAYMLYNAKIRSIKELAGSSTEELINKVNLDTRNLGEGTGCSVKEQNNRLGSYSKQQIQLAINKAQEYLGINKSELITILKMDKDLACKLDVFANVRSIEDLSTRNEEYIYDKLSVRKPETDKTTIKKYIDLALKYMSMDKSDFKKKLNMDKELAFKISHFASINFENLKDYNSKDIHEKICDYKGEPKEIHDSLCKYPEEIIQKFIEEASKLK